MIGSVPAASGFRTFGMRTGLVESWSSIVTPAAVAAAVVAWAWTVGMVIDRRRRGLPIVAGRGGEPARWGARDVAVVMAIHLCGTAVVTSSFSEAADLGTRLLANAALALGTTVAGIAWLMAHGATWRSLGLVFDRPAADLRLAVGGLAFVLVPLLALAAALNLLVPYEHPVVEYLARSRGPKAAAIVILAAVIAAPVAEEFFFRRVLQGWLERLLSGRGSAAVLTSAVAFALAHQGQGLAFVPLFPLGVVLGFIAERTGSIIPCILLHALFNAVSVTLLLARPEAASAAP